MAYEHDPARSAAARAALDASWEQIGGTEPNAFGYSAEVGRIRFARGPGVRVRLTRTLDGQVVAQRHVDLTVDQLTDLLPHLAKAVETTK